MPKADLSNYKGREQAYVKHYLLEEYLPQLAYRVPRFWDALAYVDAFAGPWQTNDPNYDDSSFGVAVEALRNSQLGMSQKGIPFSGAAILVEISKHRYPELESFANTKTVPGFLVRSINSKFVDAIPEVNRTIRAIGSKPFKFVLLDPKGWADIPMLKLRPFLNSRSCEVLVNLNTSDIVRFLEVDDRADSYHRLFGRPGVLELLQRAERHEKVEVAVREYSRSLRQLCNFHYVSAAVILEPAAESIKYFLVFATNHPRGVEVFKQAELKAARIQEELRLQKEVEKTRQPGFQFEAEPPISSFTLRLHKRYSEHARTNVVEYLKRAESTAVSYESLFCEAMAFPLVTPEDLVHWLEGLEPAIEVRIAKGHRPLSPLHNNLIVIHDRKALR